MEEQAMNNIVHWPPQYEHTIHPMNVMLIVILLHMVFFKEILY